MPYSPDDPRSQLSGRAATALSGTRAAQTFEFDAIEPDEVTPLGSRHWYVRSETAALVFTRAVAGDTFMRTDQIDEYVALSPGPEAQVAVRAGSVATGMRGEAVVVVPPGNSAIALDRDGILVRLFSCRTADVLGRCRNSALYDTVDPNVAPFAPWPDPPSGFGVHGYRLSDYRAEAGRFGRIFRCSTIMVNYLEADSGARDTRKLSPHHHDDFEQLSLQIEGDYVHHLRAPWTPNLTDWRPDEHRETRSPALTIIPPPLVHTSRGVGDTRHQLVDLFCPPRRDFSDRPGWVLNAEDYPLT